MVKAVGTRFFRPTFGWVCCCCAVVLVGWLPNTVIATTTTTASAFVVSSQYRACCDLYSKTSTLTSSSSSRSVLYGTTANGENTTSQPPNRTAWETTTNAVDPTFVTVPRQERFPLLYSITEQNKKTNCPVENVRAAGILASDDYSSSNSLLSTRHISMTWTTTITINLLATAGCVSLLNAGLMEWEWLQTLRYAWPLTLGALFLHQGVSVMLLVEKDHNDDGGTSPRQSVPPTLSILPLLDLSNESASSSSSSSSIRELSSTRWLHASIAVAGAALMVGGAADAWLPVYVTGPNLFTAAGLGPDAAAYLFVITTLSWHSSTTAKKNAADASLHLRTILLASQLYILGAGSLEDIVLQTTAAVSNAM
eukprot:scaffold1325_cov138-Amphora_coffeaeformis.AAC.11